MKPTRILKFASLLLAVCCALPTASLRCHADSAVVAWGYGLNGQTNLPADLTNVVALAAGRYHTLALRADGTVATWGADYLGLTNIPSGLSNVIAISCGLRHSLALKA